MQRSLVHFSPPASFQKPSITPSDSMWQRSAFDSLSLSTRRAASALLALLVAFPFFNSIQAGAAAIGNGPRTQAGRQAEQDAQPERLDGQLAYQVLVKICELGPRISGSHAMIQQIEMLDRYFSGLGATVQRQSFSILHPNDRTPVELTNLIVQWHPERRDRIIVCCHYDTRPFPDRDPVNRHGLFLGANDGASGVGLLYELGPFMPKIDGRYGIDFVFFDAEEFVYDAARDPLFLGSTHFAKNYVTNPPDHRYVAGVLVDMIGDKDLNIYYERNSMQHARDITRSIWRIAERQNIDAFIPRVRHTIRDDHLPLINIARIPTCDIIDFDFPNPASKNSYWHTQQDTPDKCSPESLAKVGNVLLVWLDEMGKQR